MIFVYLTWLGWRDLNPRNDSVKDCCLYRLTTSHQIISEEELVVGLVYQQFRGGNRRYILTTLIPLVRITGLEPARVSQ